LKTISRVLAARPEQGQDRAAILERPSGQLLAVADGASGLAGGAAAADHVISTAAKVSDWFGLLARADDVITEDLEAGEAAAVIAWVSEQRVAGCGIGDCAAWLVTESDVEDLTASGDMGARLGSGRFVLASFDRPHADATLLLMTDGLWKQVPRREIVAILKRRDLESAAEGLVRAARLPSGGLQDDIAFILCRQE